jgi:hypothetical protein
MKTSTILIGIILFIVVMGYFIIKTLFIPKTTHVNKEDPYQNYIGKTLTLKEEVTLAENLPNFVFKEPFFITTQKELFEGIEPTEVLPVGHDIKLIDAFHQKEKISGVTTSYVIGEVYSPTLNKTIRFEHSWGYLHDFCVEEPCHYWTFEKAIWQNEEDNAKYFMNK